MDDDQQSLTVLHAVIAEMRRILDAQRLEIDRLVTGTAVLQAEELKTLAQQTADHRRRIAALEGWPYVSPTSYVEH